MNFEERIKKIKTFLDKKNIDCLITKNRSHIFYLTGLHNAEGYLCISHKDITFFTGGIYYQYAVDRQKKSSIFFSVEKLEKNSLYKFLNGFKKPAVFSGEISLDGWRKLSRKVRRLYVIDDFIGKLRSIKEPQEIENIKKALSIAQEVLKNIKKLIKPGISELDISAEILYQTRKYGGDREAFQPIVASGVNSSYPHHFPTKRKFRDNDIVVIDMGVSVDGYNSDITETFTIGKVVEEKLKVIKAIKEAHIEIQNMIENGERSCKKIHQCAVKVFKKNKLHKFFTHGTGHGVGIDVHEFPVINSTSRENLQEGNVFTIEPGIYLPEKFGARIEKMYLLPHPFSPLS